MGFLILAALSPAVSVGVPVVWAALAAPGDCTRIGARFARERQARLAERKERVDA